MLPMPKPSLSLISSASKPIAFVAHGEKQLLVGLTQSHIGFFRPTVLLQVLEGLLDDTKYAQSTSGLIWAGTSSERKAIWIPCAPLNSLHIARNPETSPSLSSVTDCSR